MTTILKQPMALFCFSVLVSLTLDTERAMSLKVRGTPAVFVNDKMLSPEEMSRIDGIIKRALDRAEQ